MYVAVNKQGDKGTLFYIIFTGSIKVSSCDIHELAFYNLASLNLNWYFSYFKHRCRMFISFQMFILISLTCICRLALRNMECNLMKHGLFLLENGLMIGCSKPSITYCMKKILPYRFEWMHTNYEMLVF